MPSIPPIARPLNATNIGQSDGPASAVGSFKPRGWGLTSPIRSLTFNADGSFTASVKGGGNSKGTFAFRDGAAAFSDTLRLTGADGRELLFTVIDAVKNAQGLITRLDLAPLRDRGSGLPFTLVLT